MPVVPWSRLLDCTARRDRLASVHETDTGQALLTYNVSASRVKGLASAGLFHLGSRGLQVGSRAKLLNAK